MSSLYEVAIGPYGGITRDSHYEYVFFHSLTLSGLNIKDYYYV